MLTGNYETQNNHFDLKKLSDDYETPDWFWRVLNDRFDFGADMACDSKNCKVKGSPLFDKGGNGLYEDWSKWNGTKYVFPPFSKPYFSKYIHKARLEWERGQESVVLAPQKTISVGYFQEAKPPLVYMVYPRIKFIFNGSMNEMAEAVCLLIYSNDFKIEDAVTPKLKFLDLSNDLPFQNMEKRKQINSDDVNGNR